MGRPAYFLSTIRNVDNILVLEQGQVVEQGTHEQLLSRGGMYAQLVSAQMTGPAGGPRTGLTIAGTFLGETPN